MILDHLQNAHLYESLHPLFNQAFDYLKNTDFTALENGKYELAEDDLFAIVNSYNTEPREARKWEAHRKYIDIQYIVSGTEEMAVAPLHTMKIIQPYQQENDYALFDGNGHTITVPAGFFTIFYPTDVHMPNLIHHQPSHVKKVVLKVRVEETTLLKLCFASNNKYKLEEIRRLLNDSRVALYTLEEMGIREALPENGNTLEYNAWQKANHVYSLHGLNCFADDTGLEVEALNGEPGVYSARYAGENATASMNIEKLLNAMQGKSNRKARFRTVISLMMNATEYRFEGIVNGRIAESPKGSNGFGYDPVFIPEGETRTFAEMSLDEKNKFSHRAKAIENMVRFLKENYLKNT
jgi:XTP/dITP diphosphohydrolase